MKAILITSFVEDPSILKPAEVPKPVPKPDQVLVRITHVSPQHADILHAQGKHQNNNAKKGWCHPPFILGYDFAGVVESLPYDSTTATDLKVGDVIFGAGIGAFAEFIAIKPDAIRKVPAGLTPDVACAMSGQAVSYASVVNCAKVEKNECVLVSGASGGLGSMCCLVSKAVGAKVIALAGDETKAKAMRSDMGLDHVIVMDESGDWIKQVMKITNGVGVNVVLDNTGMVNDAIRCLAYMGRVVILGFAARKGVMESVKMNKLLLKSATMIGFRFGETGRRRPEELRETMSGYWGMLERGELKPMLYGKYEGLEDVPRALGDLAGRKVYGKVVVSVGNGKSSARL